MGSWGTILYRHRRKILLVWLVVFAAVIAFGGNVFARFETGFGDDASEPARGAARLRELEGTDGQIVAVVDGVDVSAPGVRVEILDAARDLAAMDGVVRVFDASS